jgi:hypothetical protein
VYAYCHNAMHGDASSSKSPGSSQALREGHNPKTPKTKPKAQMEGSAPQPPSIQNFTLVDEPLFTSKMLWGCYEYRLMAYLQRDHEI